MLQNSWEGDILSSVMSHMCVCVSMCVCMRHVNCIVVAADGIFVAFSRGAICVKMISIQICLSIKCFYFHKSQVASRERASFFADRSFTFLCFRMFRMEIMCACGILKQAHATATRRHVMRQLHALHANMKTTTKTASEVE